MSYDLINPPFSLKFRDMSKSELRRYFDWVMQEMPKRIELLREEVISSPRFKFWKADCLPGSLDELGMWFSEQIELRELSKARLIEGKHGPLATKEHELTARTFSLAFDVGLYLAQVFLRNHKSLKWKQDTKVKNFIDYGHVLITGFGPVDLNPIGVVTTLAYGISRKTKNGTRLREIYEIWSKDILGK